MAYLVDDEHKKQEEQGQVTGPEKVIASEAVAPSGGASAAPAQAGQPKATKSGSFTNLMNYVGANAGNDTKMGQAVSNVVKTQADDATAKTQNYQSGANEQIKQATVQQDQTLQQNLVNDPTKVNKDQLNAQLTAEFKGETDATRYQGYNDAAQAYNRVDERVAQAGGDLNQRTGLLEEVYNRPTYTQGEKRLDSFILGTGEGGKAQLKNIQDTYGNARSNLSNARSTVDQQIGTARDTTTATRAAAQEAVKRATGKYQGILSNATEQARIDNEARQKLFADEKARLEQLALGDGDSQIDTLKSLGFSEADAVTMYRGGTAQDAIRNFYQYNGDVTAGTYVTPEEQAEYEALQALIDGKSDFDFTRNDVHQTPVTRNTPQIDALLAQASGNISRVEQEALIQDAARAARQAEADRIENERIDKIRQEEQTKLEQEKAEHEKNRGKSPNTVAVQENGNWFTDGIARWFGH